MELELELGVAIVMVLRVLWSGAVGAALVGLLPLGALSELVRDGSRRGKLKLATTADHPPRFSVPQRWFAHFYLLGCLVNSLLLAVAFLFACSCTFIMQSLESQVSAVVTQLGGAGTRDSSGTIGNVGHVANYKGRAWTSVVVLSMLELQLLRRLSESIHLSHYSPLARMHVLGYLVGLGFYPAASLTLFSQHFEDRDYFSLLCTFAVKRLGRVWILHTGAPLLDSHIEWKDYVKCLKDLEAFQWVGLCVFFMGWFQQFRLHSILAGAPASASILLYLAPLPRIGVLFFLSFAEFCIGGKRFLTDASLRRKKVGTGVDVILNPLSPVDKRRADWYEIPRGSWFEWVSCPHYFAEVVLYAGIVIASDGHNLNIWLFYAWVVLNLTLAARETHAWYKRKFEDYPPIRRAMFPLIY